MGGSLGLAAKRHNIADEVCGYARREESRTRALEINAVDTVTETIPAAVENADIAVFCLPVFTISEQIKQYAGYFPSHCVITDVGSTKTDIVNTVTPLFKNTNNVFVGSHPIAGSDKTGIEAASADLYNNSVVIITPQENNLPAAAKIINLWKSIGAATVIMTPEQHDKIIAATSHLPHIIAAILVDAVLNRKSDDINIAEFCGTGFKDTTRIAAGSEEIWHDIIKSNKSSILTELNNFSNILDNFTQLLKNNDFEQIKELLAGNMKRRKNIDTQESDYAG